MPLIVVHRVDLRHDGDAGMLCAQEQARAARFKVEHARRAFVVCRVALRALLAERVGAAPHEVMLVRTPHGKPQLTGGGVSFNVSHSGDVGLIAVAEGEHRLGVDVECVRPRDEIAGLAERFLHPAEAASVGGCTEGFFRWWTRKEAVVKAIGDGLSYPLDDFAIDVDAPGPAPVGGVEGLTVVPLDVGWGYEAALAADVPAEVLWGY